MYKCSSCIPSGTTLMSVVCLTPTSLGRPDPAVLLKETVKRTCCLCVSCPFVCVCLPVCNCFFCSSFLTHCPAKGIPSQAAVRFNLGHKVKQKRGFLRDSSWATVQSLKRMERQGGREGEVRAASEEERVSKWTDYVCVWTLKTVKGRKCKKR